MGPLLWFLMSITFTAWLLWPLFKIMFWLLVIQVVLWIVLKVLGVGVVIAEFFASDAWQGLQARYKERAWAEAEDRRAEAEDRKARALAHHWMAAARGPIDLGELVEGADGVYEARR